MTETEVCAVVEHWLQRQGFKTNIEVPFEQHRWDLVGWTKDDAHLTAVECKPKWRLRAVDQASAMCRACEAVYIAIPATGAEAAAMWWPPEATDLGLGLLLAHSGGECEVAREARPSAVLSMRQRNRILKLAQELPREGVEYGQHRKALPFSRWLRQRELDLALAANAVQLWNRMPRRIRHNFK